jgi:hypothetical protein
LREQLDLFRSLGDQAGRAYAIWEAAALLAADAQHTEAAQLFGLAEACTQAIHLGLASDLHAEYAQARARTQQWLGEPVFANALAIGHAMDMDSVRV